MVKLRELAQVSAKLALQSNWRIGRCNLVIYLQQYLRAPMCSPFPFPLEENTLPHRHSGRRNVLAAAASLTAAVITATVLLPTVGAGATAGCGVTYQSTGWPGGFTTNITIRNLGDPINGWTLTFAFLDTTQRVHRPGVPRGRRAA